MCIGRYRCFLQSLHPGGTPRLLQPLPRAWTPRLSEVPLPTPGSWVCPAPLAGQPCGSRAAPGLLYGALWVETAPSS